MGKFVVYGVLIEEPSKSKTSQGVDCVTLLIEEKFKTAYNKEIVNVYSVDFIGKGVNCVPDNMRLVGCTVVATGTIASREYKGKYYSDLRGDTLTIIDASTFARSVGATPTQVVVEETEESIESANTEAIDLPDDDLPF